MTTFVQDFRFALRLLGRYKGFTALSVLTLALGIGATTAIFTVVNAVLLRPLPYAAPHQLVMLRAEGTTGQHEPLLTLNELTEIQQRASTLARVEGLLVVNGNLGAASDFEPMERVPAASVTEGFHEMLGVRPVLGRPLARGDATPDAVRSIVISHELWQSRFGGDASVIDRVVLVNNMRVAVAGVLPQGFRLLLSPDANIPARIDVWLPPTFDDSPHDRMLTVIGRLASGASPASARAELDAIAAQVTAEHPARYPHLPLSLQVESLQADTARASRPAIIALMGAVSFVLLIACANLANLLLGRASARTRELAVRSALGAGRWRLVRQLTTEGLLIGALGGGVGLLLVPWAESLLLWLRPATLPALEALPIDGRVLAFALVATVASSVLFSLVPAWHGTRLDVQGILKATSPSAGSRHGRLRPALVVVEVALAIVLLAGAGLMLRTMAALGGVPAGFDSRGVLTLQATMQPSAFREYEKKWQFYQSAMDRLRALPGVESVGAVRPLPFESLQTLRPVAVGDAEILAESYTTLPDYFATMGIRVHAGRDFTADDLTSQRPVVIVDEAFARAAWPGQNAIGKTLRTADRRDAPLLTVIGVTGHVFSRTLRHPGKPQVYLPYHEYALFDMAVVIRAVGDPRLLAGPARMAIEALGGNRPTHTIRLMDEYVADTMAEGRFALVLLSLFAGLALTLAAIGIYGVISHTTAQRTREIGVRVALGATRADVLRLVFGDGLRWAAVGVVLGLLGSAVLTRYLEALLFEVRANDPLTLAVVSGGLMAVAALACYIPARRAGRLDASDALRSQ